MAVAGQAQQDTERLIAESGLDGLEIAAINSPNSVTLSGTGEDIRAFAQFARKRRVAVRALDLAYPFHSALLEPLRQPLLDALDRVDCRDGVAQFFSTVTGGALAGSRLDGDYWWRNVREPVQFKSALTAAAQNGASLFIEIGPRPILTANITDTLHAGGFDGNALCSLTDKEGSEGTDPLLLIAARALVLGLPLRPPPACSGTSRPSGSSCRPIPGSTKPIASIRPARRSTSMVRWRAIR